MTRLFVDVCITLAVSSLSFAVTIPFLWRLKSVGVYTVLLGFFFEVVLTFAGFALAPHVMRYHPKAHPAGTGIALGCGISMMFIVMWHLMQKQKNRETKMP